MDIIVRDLAFTYPSGVQALRGIDLAIPAGTSAAIIGENGAGKTTFAKLLNGLLQPARGQVLVGGWNTADHTPAQLARRVGYAFQNPDQQIFASRVIDEVEFGPKNLGCSTGEIAQFSQEALAAVGLDGLEEKHPYDLHLADRKLLSLAAVLAMQTPILIFDEPTTGQDAGHINQIGLILEKLQAEGRTVLTISHDLDFCAAYFERVILLRGGELAADGPAREILLAEELLASAAVDPPQLARLALGLGLDRLPRTPEEFVEIYQNKGG